MHRGGAMRRIRIKDLKPGYMLALPINLPRTGVALLKEGVELTQRHIAYLRQYGLQEEFCFIFDGSEQRQPSLEDRVILQHFRADILRSIENMELQNTLVSTYIALEDLADRIKSNSALVLQPVQKVSEKLMRQVLEHNDVMLQLAALKAIHEYTFCHSVNVAIYVVSFGKFLGLREGTLQQLALAGLLHDLGKLSIPAEILDKPGRLTAEEFKQVKGHTYEGYRRLAEKTGVGNDVLQAVLMHHERFDGSGYLLGLQGQKIHPWARMLAIVDIYDALTSRRCYREAVLPHETVDYLMALSTQGALDFKMLSVYLRHMPVYPGGLKVTLSTGEKGAVVETTPGLPLRPVVEVSSLAGGKQPGKGAPAEPVSIKRKRVDLAANPTVFITSIDAR